MFMGFSKYWAVQLCLRWRDGLCQFCLWRLGLVMSFWPLIAYQTCQLAKPRSSPFPSSCTTIFCLYNLSSHFDFVCSFVDLYVAKSVRITSDIMLHPEPAPDLDQDLKQLSQIGSICLVIQSLAKCGVHSKESRGREGRLIFLLTL